MVRFTGHLFTVIVVYIINLTITISDGEIVNEIPKSIPTTVEPCTNLSASGADIHNTGPEFISEYNCSRPMKKIVLCAREGIVEHLKAIENDESRDSHCKIFKPDHPIRDLGDLSYMNISGFFKNWFDLKSTATSRNFPDGLNLKGNKIVNVSSEVLKNLPEYIKTVTLDENKIERLRKGSIVNARATIFLFRSNYISEIEEGAFENTTVRYIALDNNRLTNTSFVATLPSTLKNLRLANNQIQHISGQSFSKFINLSHLDLRGNNINALENSSRLRLPSLWYLSLEENNLTKIESGFFQDLKNLTTLYLSGNNLTELDDGVFSGLEKLDYLDLSENQLIINANGFLHNLPKSVNYLGLASNGIVTLKRGTFFEVPTYALFLGHNKITTIEEGSFDLPELKLLHLDNNALTKLNNESFVGLMGLRFLSVKNNSITEVQEGAFENTTATSIVLDDNRLTNTSLVATLPSELEELSLAKNQIQHISGQSFSKFINLYQLILRGNNINALENSSRLLLPSLMYLRLDENNLTKIESGFFQDLKSLTNLNLSRNNLIELDDGVFSGLEKLLYLDLSENQLIINADGFLHNLPKSLAWLMLRSNGIVTLKSGTFSGVPIDGLGLNDNKITTIEEGSFYLPELKELYLGYNALTKLNNESFVGLMGLRFLSVKNNNITEVDDGFAKNLPNIIRVEIPENPYAPLGLGDPFTTEERWSLRT